METLQQLIDRDAPLNIGDTVEFLHSSKAKSKNSEDVINTETHRKVSLKTSVLLSFLENCRKNEDNRLTDLLELEKVLFPLVDRKNNANLDIKEAKEKKKELGIAQWKKVKELSLATYDLHTRATEDLIKVKEELKELVSKTKREEKSEEDTTDLSKFLKYYRPVKELDDNSYTVKTIYAGKYLSNSYTVESLFIDTSIYVKIEDIDTDMMVVV